MTGRKFNLLTATKRIPGNGDWWFQCECGKQTRQPGWGVRHGKIKSCGCVRVESIAISNTIHGHVGTPEYIAWKAAKGRCYNQRNKAFKYYGMRGIGMSDKWRNDFSAFLTDVGSRPTPFHSLDRINVNGNYEPGNVRWATKEQQANNYQSSKRYEYLGQFKTFAEWGREFGLPGCILRTRLIKCRWTMERALTTPIDKSHPTHGRKMIRA